MVAASQCQYKWNRRNRRQILNNGGGTMDLEFAQSDFANFPDRHIDALIDRHEETISKSEYILKHLKHEKKRRNME